MKKIYIFNFIAFMLFISYKSKGQSAQENNINNNKNHNTTIINTVPKANNLNTLSIPNDSLITYYREIMAIVDSSSIAKVDSMYTNNIDRIKKNLEEAKQKKTKIIIDSLKKELDKQVEIFENIKKSFQLKNAENQYLMKIMAHHISSVFKPKTDSLKNTILSKKVEIEKRRLEYSFWQNELETLKDVSIMKFRDSSLIKLYLLNESNLMQLDKIDLLRLEYNKIYKKIRPDSGIGYNNTVYADLSELSKKLDNEIIKFRNTENKIYDDTRIFQIIYSTKTNAKEPSIDAIPNITSLLGQNFVTPNITLKGKTNLNFSNNFIGEIRIFTAAINNNKLQNESILVTESSPYGIILSLNGDISSLWQKHKQKHIVREKLDDLRTLRTQLSKIDSIVKLIKAKDMSDLISIKYYNQERFLIEKSINDIRKGNYYLDGYKKPFSMYGYFNANYLGKNFFGIDSTNNNDTTFFTSDIIHLKFGTQLVFLNDLFSIYANVNFINNVVNKEKVIAYYNPLAKRFNTYFDIGTKFFINIKNDHPLNLFVDTNFIFINKKVNSIIKTPDSLVPSIKIGLVKPF